MINLNIIPPFPSETVFYVMLVIKWDDYVTLNAVSLKQFFVEDYLCYLPWRRVPKLPPSNACKYLSVLSTPEYMGHGLYLPFNSQIKFVILLTVNHTILIMLVQRI